MLLVQGADQIHFARTQRSPRDQLTNHARDLGVLLPGRKPAEAAGHADHARTDGGLVRILREAQIPLARRLVAGDLIARLDEGGCLSLDLAQ